MISSSAGGGGQNQTSGFMGDMGYRLHFCKMPLASGGYHPLTPKYIHVLYLWLPLYPFLYIICCNFPSSASCL